MIIKIILTLSLIVNLYLFICLLKAAKEQRDIRDNK